MSTVREHAVARVQLQQDDAAAVVRLAGDLDMAVAPELESQLRSASDRRRDVVVDAREVRFIDCAAIGVLAMVASEIEAAGGHLRLLPSRPVERLCSLTGLRFE